MQFDSQQYKSHFSSHTLIRRVDKLKNISTDQSVASPGIAIMGALLFLKDTKVTRNDNNGCGSSSSPRN